MTNAKNDSAEPGNVVGQYETLRRAALGDALPPDARAGLMLFLQRGMWGWACALATTIVTKQLPGSRTTNWKPPEECRTIIYIFAAITIRTSFQGATA
jgi:hypothetical protein